MANTPFKMKGSPMQRNFGEWFKTTELGKNLKAVGEDLQDKSKKVKTFTEGVTSKVASDVSELAKTDVPKKFASDVRKLLSRKKKK